MSKKAIIFAALLCLACITLSVSVFQHSKSKSQQQLLSSEGSVTVKGDQAVAGGVGDAQQSLAQRGSASSDARIVNQWLTAEGKTVVVEKEGRLWTNLIPDTMLSLTDEQILELVDVLDAPPPPRSSPAPDTLNKRLLF
jgi:hypothetical protein